MYFKFPCYLAASFFKLTRARARTPAKTVKKLRRRSTETARAIFSAGEEGRPVYAKFPKNIPMSSHRWLHTTEHKTRAIRPAPSHKRHTLRTW